MGKELYEGWAGPTTEAHRQYMKTIGFKVVHIFFSGFGSQGDGACFEGHVDNWPLFLKTHVDGYGTDKTPIPAVELLDDILRSTLASPPPPLRLELTHRGRYYHEHSVNMGYGISAWCDSEHIEGMDAMWSARLQYEIEWLEPILKEALQNRMRVLYHELEAEHDYLMKEMEETE